MTLWRRLFGRRRLEQQLDKELQLHLDRQVRDNIAAGMSEDEACRKASLAFGGMDGVKEECRDVRTSSLIDSTAQDFRYAMRLIRKNWAFSFVVVLSLALGIGANIAIFTLIDAVMWRMLPVKDPQNLLVAGRTENEVPARGFTYAQFRAMRENGQAAELAGYSPQRVSVSIEGNPEPATDAHLVSGNYFALLGVNAIAGRTITNDDDRVVNGHPVAMISYRYWTTRFARDPATIGKTFSVSGTPFTIIGITPPEFFGTEVGRAPDIFVPMMMQPAIMPVYENLLDNPNVYSTWIEVLARLHPGVLAAGAAAALEPAFVRNVPPPKFGGAPPRLKVVLTSAATGVSALRHQFSEPLFVVMALVGMVLLIACANIANLFLARAAARNGEFALRLAIGAGRLRLTRQLLTESIVLATLGGVFAILLSQWATRLLLLYMSAGQAPVVLDLSPNPRVIAFTAIISIATGVVFGLAAAFRARHLDLAPALKNLRSSGKSAGRPGPRKALAAAQVSLSLVLIIGAGLFVRSLWNLNRHDAGFPRDRVLIARIEPAGSDQRNRGGALQRLDAIYSQLLERVSAIPGVRLSSLANVSPAKPNSGCCGALDPNTQRVVLVPQVMVYPKYFQTMGVSIVKGRDFADSDFVRNAPPVLVVNETLARTRFNGEEAIGKRMGPAQIVGVVRDSKYTNLKGPTPPTSYIPFLAANTGRGQMILHVRTSLDPNLIAARVREEVWKADPAVPQFDVHTLAEEVDAVLIQERLTASLSTVLGGLALLLASVGLYGLLSFAVVQRTGEVGIRMALGAIRGDVMWMILREALTVVLAGIGIGLPVAVVLARAAAGRLPGLFFGLAANDPFTIGAAAALLGLVGVIAAYVPARRASRVDPMVALRNE
jgi:predicted permease